MINFEAVALYGALIVFALMGLFIVYYLWTGKGEK